MQVMCHASYVPCSLWAMQTAREPLLLLNPCMQSLSLWSLLMITASGVLANPTILHPGNYFPGWLKVMICSSFFGPVHMATQMGYWNEWTGSFAHVPGHIAIPHRLAVSLLKRVCSKHIPLRIGEAFHSSFFLLFVALVSISEAGTISRLPTTWMSYSKQFLTWVLSQSEFVRSTQTSKISRMFPDMKIALVPNICQSNHMRNCSSPNAPQFGLNYPMRAYASNVSGGWTPDCSRLSC